ncbi:unnamed protein product [Acidithrix sp. C25]|nr:unnamed protein product [Acidithrix sp. C25]
MEITLFPETAEIFALCADAVVALTPMAGALTANAPNPTAIFPVILLVSTVNIPSYLLDITLTAFVNMDR